MNRTFLKFISLGLVMLCSSLKAQMADNFNPKQYPFPSGNTAQEVIPGELLLKLTPSGMHLWFDLDSSFWKATSRSLQLTHIEKALPNWNPPKESMAPVPLVALDHIFRVHFPDTLPSYTLAARLFNTPGVEWAEPALKVQPLVTPNDPNYSQQWFLPKIGADSLWNISLGDTNVVVAVVDGGTNFAHPDLQANLALNYADPVDGIDNDGDGYIDNFRGWDLGDWDNDPSYNPTGNQFSIHGTGMCGLVAATTNNNLGVAGVGWNIRYLPVKMVNASNGWTRGYEGIVYAADHGADVINCSWGGTGVSHFARDVLDYASLNRGCLLVAAGGNSNNTVPVYPAAYPQVIGVASTDINDNKGGSSSFYNLMNLAAPGIGMHRTWGGGYATSNGTSDASAVTSGAAGLLLSALPNLSPWQVGARILNHADAIDTMPSNIPFAGSLGEGRLNVWNAYNQPSRARLHYISREHTDADGDGVFLPGDTVLLSGFSWNLLAASHGSLSAEMEAFSPYVQWIDSTQSLGVVQANDTVSHATAPFRFVVDPATPTNTLVHFRIQYADTASAGRTDFFLYLHPQHMLWDENDIHISVTNTGQMGYSDGSAQAGIGWRRPGGAAQLMEIYFNGMGFWLGHNQTVLNQTLSAPITGCCPLDQQNHFQATAPISTIHRGDHGVKTIRSYFKDTLLNQFEVMRYAWGDTAAQNRGILFLDHWIKNTGNQPINNLYAGYFCDLDMHDSLFYKNANIAAWDAQNRLGYQKNANHPVSFGMVLLQSGTPHYYAIDVSGNNGSMAITDGFSDAEKWQVMTGGIGRPGGPVSDFAQYLGGEIPQIDTSGCALFSMALVTGQNLSEAQAFAQEALQRYQNSVNVWTGAALNSNWHDAANWSRGTVPNPNDRVYIVAPSAAQGLDPVISQSDAHVAYLETLCGGNLTVLQGRKLEVGP